MAKTPHGGFGKCCAGDHLVYFYGGIRGSVSAQGKVLYVHNYPKPSFGPFLEVCCSIIGVFKLLMHLFIHFHAI